MLPSWTLPDENPGCKSVKNVSRIHNGSGLLSVGGWKSKCDSKLFMYTSDVSQL